jgi:isoamyl acetate esterase
VQPSLVIVYFGGNDSIAAHPSGLGPHVPIDEYIINMRKIAEHLKVVKVVIRHIYMSCTSDRFSCLLVCLPLICVQSLSEKTRVIFLSCPPLNEAMLRKSTRYVESCHCKLLCVLTLHCMLNL